MKTFIFILSILFTLNSYSQKLNVKSGNWTKNLRASDISEVGNDYSNSYLSKTNQSKITYSSYPKNKNDDKYAYFILYVHKEDYTWHPDLKLELKRTSGSTNGNSTYYGTNFQTISNNTALFFYSVGKVKNIPIQYQISGLSVL